MLSVGLLAGGAIGGFVGFWLGWFAASDRRVSHESPTMVGPSLRRPR